MASANFVDYVVIALYALLMVRVGFYVLRFNRGAAEYFRGGSRIPWLVAGLSCFMAGFSAWTFTGAAGVAYRSGIAAIGLYIGNALSFLLGYFVFAKRWRRTRITTVMEYLSGRFNPGDASGFFLDHDCVPAVHQRQHSVWAQPVRIFRLRFSGDVDHSRRWRLDRFLLRAGWPVGRGRHRFSASLHPHAVLHGSGRHVAGPRGRSERPGAFAAAGNENASCFRRVWLALHRLMDDHGFVRLQHQRHGAALFQRG